MSLVIRAYTAADVEAMRRIWNEVVAEGVAFPQTAPLSTEEAVTFFAEQTHCGVAEADGDVHGMYILHPNNVGRCGHIANASYAVASDRRGHGIGERLVKDSLAKARAHGFRIMQFNAVVAANTRARRLYERLGFQPLGIIPRGFLMKDGHYEDICPYYYEL